MKVFGSQTNPDISTGQDVPHLMGNNGHLVSKIYKYHFLHIILLMKIMCNIVILFTHFLVKKPKQTKELNMCCFSSVPSIHFDVQIFFLLEIFYIKKLRNVTGDIWKVTCDTWHQTWKKTIFLWTLKFWELRFGGKKSVNYYEFEIATKQCESNI